MEKPMRTVIGLETHLQLKTGSKLFCDCSTKNYREAQANSLVCPTCLAQPGAKPWGINEQALAKVVSIALALNCKLNVGKQIFVQRKHYFYPDLASGFQRTSTPIGVGGELAGVRIREVHVEEDPGQYDLKEGIVNFNRSGVPLIEIVTEPDMDSPQKAREFLEELSAILNYLGAARDEPGSMRVDANISISIGGAEGTRAEVKNINSFKGVATALSFEAARQKNLLKNGLKVAMETRHFDENAGVTATMRRKESVDDYRYFPDPDVPPVVITRQMVEEARKKMPELPREKMRRFEKTFGVSKEEAFALTMEKELADAFEEDARKFDKKIVTNFYRGVLKKQLNWRTESFEESKVSKEATQQILEMLEKKEITDKVAEQLLIAFLDKGELPKENAEKHGLLGVQGTKELEKIVKKIVKENEKVVDDYRKGNKQAIHFLAGQVMKETRGKANPQDAKKLLEKMMK